MITIVWICVMLVSHHAYGIVITINNSGDDSSSCCTYGNCTCGSLYDALSSIKSNTVVNITSPAVSLHNTVYLGSGSLNNITIMSNNGATVMCNNTGTVFCYMCSDVTIQGIIWNQCGDPNNPLKPGIAFYVISNISIINCTFEEFRSCNSISLSRPTGTINVINSNFMFNMILNASLCSGNTYSSLRIYALLSTCKNKLNLTITISNSLFYQNGNATQQKIIHGCLMAYLNCYSSDSSLSFETPFLDFSILVKNTNFISNSITGVFIYDTSINSKISFNNVNFSENNEGVIIKCGNGSQGLLNVESSVFQLNRNGALSVELLKGKSNKVEVYNSSFTKNYGNNDTHGTALSITFDTYNNSTCNISFCNFFNNIGGSSVVYIIVSLPKYNFPTVFTRAFITSSNFTGNKIGSALYITKCFLKFYSTSLFQHNSAKSGAAIYIAQASQITVDDGSTVQFVNNTASLHGGAMYIDLTKCYDHGIVFTNITRYDAISFINNSAKLSGNSIYFDIHEYCDIIRNYVRSDSAAYIPYKFNYTQSHSITGSPIATTPYDVSLCSSAKCKLVISTNSSSKCNINNTIMLGQPLYFNATICDYFYAPAEATYFQVKCVNCGTKYRLLDNKILVQNGLKSNISFLSVNANRDLQNNTNITLKLLSYSPNYKKLTTTFSLTLSSCYNGFLFNEQSQHCKCYKKDGYLQCERDTAHIKFGYWLGVFSGVHTLALCGNNYCNFFTHRKETSNGFYNLPVKIDDQCKPHRTGVACGECSKGYTLAYNSPDCISVDKCSPKMMILVLVLTTLYWIIILVFLFGVAWYLKMKAKMSIGYLHGIIYFYSTVDILLCNNLYIADQVFYTVTSLSSFAKLNPRFLGRLCFITDLEAVDQQFIHYCHAIIISIFVIGIVITAKFNKKMSFYIDHCIVRVVCLFLLLSYSSLTSISLLLLKPLKLDNIDGLYTSLSPHLKYFTNHHVIYGSVAIFCGFLAIISSLLLLIEPCPWSFVIKKFTPKCRMVKCGKMCKGFKRKTKKCWLKMRRCIKRLKKCAVFVRSEQIVNQFQDCYKDHCRWFAAYYLICRLVIISITCFANHDYDNMLYYLQTACVVIVLIHILVQPYKSDILNLIDTILLLNMLLIVNLNFFSFSTLSTSGFIISLVITPLLLLIGMKAKNALKLGITIKKLTKYLVKKLHQTNDQRRVYL